MTVRRFAWELPLVAILGLFLVAGFFAHPIADDLDFASSAREAGVLTAWRQQYLTWNGRYASNLFALATPWRFSSLAGYRAVVGLLVMATVAALYVFLRTLGKATFTSGEAMSGALMVSVLFLAGMPAVGEGVYWLTSAATYQAAVILALLHFACVVRCTAGAGAPIRLLAIVLLVAVVGCNEVMMLIVLAVYVALLGWSLAGGAPYRSLFATMLAVTVVCTAVLVLSPGNAARAAVYPDRHELVRSMTMTALQTVRFVGGWVSSGPLLIASALWMGHADRFAGLVDRARARVPLLLCCAGIALAVPISVFPAYWATGILGQHRTVNTAYFVFLIFWFAGLALWSVSGGKSARAVQAFARELGVPLAVLLVVSLGLARNSYALGEDLARGRLASFDREMSERDRALRECRLTGQRPCDIAAIQTVPASFFVLDVSADPRDWVNVAYARYYGLSEVRLGPHGSIDHVRH